MLAFSQGLAIDNRSTLNLQLAHWAPNFALFHLIVHEAGITLKVVAWDKPVNQFNLIVFWCICGVLDVVLLLIRYIPLLKANYAAAFAFLE